MSSAFAPDDAGVRARIDRFLADTGLLADEPTIVPLAGDASDRRYFRVQLRDAPWQVLSVYPGPLDLSTLPFVNVARLLSAMPVPVPRVLAHSDALGILALEDLGDVTFQSHLANASADERAARYEEAVGLINTIQQRGLALASPDYVPYRTSFDVAKLTWELHFFTAHFLEAYRGAALADAARAALADEYSAIAEELADEPQVVCHRDYHSRNLMWHDGRLYVIDFQDARMGPDTYDLASLLRDSYVDVEDHQVETLIATFLARRGASAADDRDFRRRFDLMGLQRNLKALGTFGFQATSRQNAAYAQYVPRTLKHVRSNLGRYSRFGGLHDLLAAHLDELR
jgi:aminoglycoside/choline kinase family phosphotransferase